MEVQYTHLLNKDSFQPEYKLVKNVIYALYLFVFPTAATRERETHKSFW